MKKNKRIVCILLLLLVTVTLLAACGGGKDQNEEDAAGTEAGQVAEEQREAAGLPAEEGGTGAAISMTPAGVKSEDATKAAAAGQPVNQPDAGADLAKKSKTCKISIRCATVLDNMDKLSKGKAEIIPADGMILAEQDVELFDDESAFDVLLRVTKDEKMHMEHTKTPLYKSIYIEGINNLYEFDCGELSGWMYRVNDSFPNYSSSKYQVQDGDVIQWVYTCDLGRDVGGDWNSQNL